MAEHIPAYYADCLPVASSPDTDTHDEIIQLEMLLLFDEVSDYSPYSIAKLVHDRNPLIEEAIEADKDDLFARHILYMSDDSLAALMDGVELGYSFAIGCVTYLQCLRSADESVTDFLDNSPNQVLGIPLQTPEQRDRFIEVILGNAPMGLQAEKDPAGEYKLVADAGGSRAVALKDTKNYLRQSPAFDNLYLQECARIGGTGEVDVRQANRQGFEHGFANAIEMYLVSYECDVLANAAVH